MTSAIEGIAAYAIDLRHSDVPDDVRDWVKFAAIDGLACAYLGLTSSPALTIERVVTEMGGHPQASLLGCFGKRSCASLLGLQRRVLRACMDGAPK
jgi:2-methylcitrate dehydratase PrpD